MGQVTRVVDQLELSAANREIHDFWFNVEDVSYYPEEQKLSVRFVRPAWTGARSLRRLLFLRRERVPLTEWYLEIGQVEDYSLEETQGVARYDFNELHFSEADQTVVIRTGIPIIFRARVKGLDVTVRDSGKVVAEKTRTTL